MEKIPSTMVIYKNVVKADTIFATMSGPSLNNPLGKRIGLIIGSPYQDYPGDIMWVYEPMPNVRPDADPVSDFNFNKSGEELSTHQDNPEDQGE